MIVVVGAGVAGLHVASSLSRQQRESRRVVLLEAKERPGGRVLSVYKDGKMQYEAGAWRVPSTHGRVIALFRQEGVKLRPLKTRGKDVLPPRGVKGLSMWGSNALSHRDPSAADRIDLETGYADETQAAAGTAPYITDAPHYYCADEGFSEMIARMARRVKELRMGCRVTDVREGRREGEYEVRYTEREGNKFTSRTLVAEAVFVCVPPSFCREWSVMACHARPVMASVRPESLNHIYVETGKRRRDEAAAPFHEKGDVTALLGQTISDQYEEGYVQASYSSGRLARFWNNLRLSGLERYVRLLKEELWSSFRIRTPFSSDQVHHHFWQTAFHTWVPTSGFELDRCVRNAVTPNAARLPGLFLCGEAFSSHQAWMEGALETAELALKAFDAPPSKREKRKKGEAVMDGRILDVSKWKEVHPGGEGAIRNHEGDDDIAALFEHINHSDLAWATAFGLQVGWAR